jgi:hypothetical protein
MENPEKLEKQGSQNEANMLYIVVACSGNLEETIY